MSGGTLTTSGMLINKLNLSGGTISAGAINISSNGVFNWSGGAISGTYQIPAGAAFNLSGSADKTLYGGVISSAGPGTWSDTGNLRVNDNGSVLNNSGKFTVLGDAQVIKNYEYSAVFINNGTFLKAGGTNTTFTSTYGGMAFNNNGTVDVRSGVLALGGGGTGTNGTFSAAAGARMELAGGQFYLNGSSTFSGAGIIRVLGDTATFGGPSTLASGGTLEVGGGTVRGASVFAGPGTFNWTGGAISAALNLPATVSFNLSGSADKALGSDGFITSAGTGTWNGVGNLNASARSGLTNSGTFTVFNDAQVTFNLGNGSSPQPVLVNNGTFLKAAGSNTTFTATYGGMAFNNNGTVDLRSGILALGGGYTPSPTSQLRLALGGLAAGTQFSQLNLGGAAALAGTLSVSLANGYSPTNGSSFAIVNYGSLTSPFSAQQLPTLSLGRIWKLDYGASALTLRVEPGQAQRQTLLSPAVAAGGAFGFEVTGPAADSAIVLASTNLVNWIPIFTNTPFSGSVHFSDPQGHPLPERFYQVLFQQ
jgi:protein involved in ribonucleotide reduction